MSTLLDALRIGLKNTQELLALREMFDSRNYPKERLACEEYDAQILLLENQIALLSREHTIRTEDYTYECGDGCCYEQGIDVFVDDERLCSVPALDYAIEELFEHFGIDVDFCHW